MTPEEFIARWKGSTRTEKSASHEHFLDLCELLDVQKPAAVDPHGTEYTFEKMVKRAGGETGYADVWKKKCFGWEYKGPKKNLVQAYAQLKQYADALGNPPLLIVSDMQEIRIHTNFTNEISEQHVFKLPDLIAPENREKLRWCFTDPEKLRPTLTREAVTGKAAVSFGEIAVKLRKQHDPRRVAHFVNKLVFCLFAEDIELLPDRIFADILDEANKRHDDFVPMMGDLFRAMANRNGRFGAAAIPWFNGGLFDDDDVLAVGIAAEKDLVAAARLDWSAIDPTIFGTLFESGLDDKKRAEMASLFDQPAPEAKQARLFDRGAPDKGVGIHYTDAGTIMKIIEPVVMRPWREEWDALKTQIRKLNAERDSTKSPKERTKAVEKARDLYASFRARLGKFRVLDPACGSGNFLALSLGALKDFDLAVSKEATADLDLPPDKQRVGPEAVLGIEINPYAAELVRLTVWITEIQWQLRNGFRINRTPILGKLDGIVCRDALINSDGTEARWPDADVVVGNPPFLGTKLMYRALGQDYTERIRRAYEGRISPFADLVCFWFEKARAQMRAGKLKRAGLVATNSIRGGRNRLVLDKIASDTPIYEAWSDEPWVVDGAAVRVSLICFAQQATIHGEKHLNGKTIDEIHSDLSGASSTRASFDLTKATALMENADTAYVGIQKTGPFDVPGDVVRQWLLAPRNPNGRTNADVLKPYWNGIDLTRRPRDYWLIDFPLDEKEREVSVFEKPFEYGVRSIKPTRVGKREERANERWWEHYWPRPEMRAKLNALPRYIVTPEVAKYRLFAWLSLPFLPDKNLTVITKDDDTTFGILHSRFHEAWALRLGTSLEDRPRYTPSTTFETFPFPEGLTPNIPATNYANDPRAVAIAAAAKRLDELRRNWLNPPDLIKIEPEVVPGYPDRVLPRGAAAETELKKRTLTNLYNERPAWLDNAHRDLDAAVAATYGWPADISEDDALARLLELNRARAETPAATKPAAGKAQPPKPVRGKAAKPKTSKRRVRVT